MPDRAVDARPRRVDPHRPRQRRHRRAAGRRRLRRPGQQHPRQHLGARPAAAADAARARPDAPRRTARSAGAAVAPMAAYGRMREASPGKDSVTGHWELMGLVLDRPFPTFPHGFPPDVIEAFEAASAARRWATSSARAPRSWTRFGAEHMRTGAPIVYTSADSVFQILAHEDVIPIEEQYAICRARLRAGRRGAGRRPGHRAAVRRPPGAFTRTANRHDFALPAAGRDAARSPGRGRRARARGREDPRSLRRPRHLDDAVPRPATTRAWTRSRRCSRASSAA